MTQVPPFPARNLDLLRATAVMAVVCAHFFGSNGQPGGTFHMHLLGLLGVLIFFVHTSLVLILSLERMLADSADRGASFWRTVARGFYVRRFFRIYPLSVFVVVAATLLKLPANIYNAYHPLSGIQLAANLALVQNLLPPCSAIGALWSLPFEVQMYVALPFLFLVAQRGSLKLLAGITFMVAAVDVAAVRAGIETAHLLDYVPCFMGGVLAFMLLRRAHRRPLLDAWLWPLALLALGTILVPLGFSWGNHKIVFWAIGGTLGVLIPGFHELPDNWFTRAAHQIAKYSYGIYLFHGPVLWLAFDKLRNLGWTMSALLFVYLTVGLSIVAYHALEHPLIEFGKTLTTRQERRESRKSRETRALKASV